MMREKEWHQEAAKLYIQGVSVSEIARRMQRARVTVSRFINDDVYQKVKQDIVDAETENPTGIIPSIQIQKKNQELEAERTNRIQKSWNVIYAALDSEDVSLAKKADIAVQILKGHGELNETSKVSVEHLGVMLIDNTKTVEEWEAEAEIIQEAEVIEEDEDFSLEAEDEY
ncbi:terminase large subunit [Rhodobacteraceae phage LS06-2018-MD07]|jgi:transposase-like protein|nr:terminase large subunit [Rhodobacteraceae phage LS06-2018-MD07]